MVKQEAHTTPIGSLASREARVSRWFQSYFLSLLRSGRATDVSSLLFLWRRSSLPRRMSAYLSDRNDSSFDPLAASYVRRGARVEAERAVSSYYGSSPSSYTRRRYETF